MPLRLFAKMALLLAALLITALPAWAETVQVPLTMDYPLVRSLLAQRSFTGPGESAVVVDELGGCTRIVLREPQVTPDGDLLSIACKIKVHAGANVLGKCLNPVEFEGYIELKDRPYLEPKTWSLRLVTEDSKLYDRQQGPPAKVTQIIWDLVKKHVHAYLDQTALNLAPPVKEMTDFIPLLFAPTDQGRVTAWIKSLRPGHVRITPTALKADLLMDVEAGGGSGAEERLSLSQDQLERFTRAWEGWDSFLVFEINSMARFPLTDGERRVLMETLLDTRHRFVAELGQEAPGQRDVVREQFVAAWTKLAPIMRRHLEKDVGGPRLSYLAFFTAADALAALDRLGPTLGLDISRNGLIRLAKLLTAQEGAPRLEYSYAVDPGLRRTLGLGQPLDERGPAFGAQELEVDLPELRPPAPDPSAPPADPGASPSDGSANPWTSQAPRRAPGQVFSLWSWLVRPAWASSEEPPSGWHEIKPWLLTVENREVYLERIKEALRVGAQKALGNARLDDGLRRAFTDLVRAAAWQESCWRQFLTPPGKITYVRSYNNTSVGMMQVNERVWRGIYNLPSLRWNALYNIRAGSEILEQYLTRYALDRQGPARALPPDTVARAVYAMYNGGPGQLDNYLKRAARKAPNQFDRLFAEKYEWAKGEQWDRLERCLGQ